MKRSLDAQEAYLYVVDMQSRELLYLNQEGQRDGSLVRTGEYDAIKPFWQRDALRTLSAL